MIPCLSQDWTTPLHHLKVVGPERARTLLRVGADTHGSPEAPAPLTLARELHAAGAAPKGVTAWLVLRAAELVERHGGGAHRVSVGVRHRARSNGRE